MNAANWNRAILACLGCFCLHPSHKTISLCRFHSTNDQLNLKVSPGSVASYLYCQTRSIFIYISNEQIFYKCYIFPVPVIKSVHHNRCFLVFGSLIILGLLKLSHRLGFLWCNLSFLLPFFSNLSSDNININIEIHVLSHILSSRLFLQVIQAVLPQGAPQR